MKLQAMNRADREDDPLEEFEAGMVLPLKTDVEAPMPGCARVYEP